MAEILDIYDKDKNKTGRTVERIEGNKLEDGEYIICVHCWIINSQNMVLLTRRALNKKHGGDWECTGGCVSSGESSKEGMIRELKEEIGLSVKEDELSLLKTCYEVKPGLNIIRDIYVLNKDVDIKDIVFSDGEVIDCKYVTVDELKLMIKEGITRFKTLEYSPFAN